MLAKKITSTYDEIDDTFACELSVDDVIHNMPNRVKTIAKGQKDIQSGSESLLNDSGASQNKHNNSFYDKRQYLNLDDALSIPYVKINNVSRRVSFNPLQEWEGYVTSVDESSFTAELYDITNPYNATEQADFPKEEISGDAVNQLKEGAVFRWSIGYTRSRSGVKRRVSQIIFRQLPQWTKKELDAAKSKAEIYSSTIAWE